MYNENDSNGSKLALNTPDVVEQVLYKIIIIITEE